MLQSAGDGFRDRGPYGEVANLVEAVRAGMPAQGKNLDAGQRAAHSAGQDRERLVNAGLWPPASLEFVLSAQVSAAMNITSKTRVGSACPSTSIGRLAKADRRAK